jgi:hypothetical protein
MQAIDEVARDRLDDGWFQVIEGTGPALESCIVSNCPKCRG